MDTSKHTPTPWEVGDTGTHVNAENGSAYSIASCHWVTAGSNWSGTDCTTERHQRANAAFIVRACNSHEQLVALVRRAQEILGAYLPPDGSSDQEAITALLELFDGPESRDALAAAGAA